MARSWSSTEARYTSSRAGSTSWIEIANSIRPRSARDGPAGPAREPRADAERPGAAEAARHRVDDGEERRGVPVHRTGDVADRDGRRAHRLRTHVVALGEHAAMTRVATRGSPPVHARSATVTDEAP